MGTLGLATLGTKVDLSGLSDGLGRAQGQTSSWLGGLGNIISTGLGVALGTGIFTAVTNAVGDAISFVQGTIADAMAAEDAQARLEAVIAATGGAAGVTADQMAALAASLQEVTRFEDETIIAGQSILLTFNRIGTDTLPRATTAMLDLAETFGLDATTAARTLGRALQDPAEGLGALGRLGVRFTDDQQKMIEAMVEAGDVAGAQAFILKELEGRIGGVAVAMGQTVAGTRERRKNLWGEIREEIGDIFLPALGEVETRLIEVFQSPAVRAGIDWLKDVLRGGTDAFMQLFNMLQAGDLSGMLNAIFGPQIAGHIETIVGQLRGLAETHGPGIMQFFRNIGDFFSQTMTAIGPDVIDNLFGALSGGLELVGEFWSKHGDSILSIADFLFRLAAVTLGNTVDMIAALANAFIQLLQGDPGAALATITEALERFVERALSIVGVDLQTFVETWKANWEMLQIIVGHVMNVVRQQIAGAFDAVRAAIQNVINSVQAFIDKLRDIVIPDWLERRSPPPLARSFTDIDRALSNLVSGSLQAFATGVQGLTQQQNISTGMILVQGNQFQTQVDFREGVLEALRSW